MSPGRGWVPQRRFQLFRCLKLAPAERCGHVTERRQSAPACLRVPAPNARRPEERRRPRPGGRVRRPRGSRGGGRDAGTRGPTAASSLLRPAPPRPGPPCLRGPLPSGTADATPPASYALGSQGPPPGSALAAPWGPARVSAPQTCGYVPPPRPRLWPPPPRGPAPRGPDDRLFPRRTLREEGKIRWPPPASFPWAHRPVEREHRMR